jgi:hypothetical protein
MHYWSNNRLLLSVMFLVGIMITCDAFVSPSCHKKILIRPYTTAKQNRVNPLLSSRNDDTDDKQQKGLSSVGEKDNFDAAGFGGYLAPYAIAFVASIGITALFVKFVLLDY